MNHLIIVGARGFGREVYHTFLEGEGSWNRDIEVKGFLDSKSDSLEGLKGDYPPILCSPEDYIPCEDDVFFIALGDPKWRKHYAEIMAAKGVRFKSIFSKNAVVFPTATVEDGAFIGGWSVISDNVVVGSHSVIMNLCTLGHDCKVGRYSTIEAYSFLGGFSEVGNESIMHVRSTLIRHKKIGNNVEVGASSVVMRNVKDGLHVFGNPAKKIDL